MPVSELHARVASVALAAAAERGRGPARETYPVSWPGEPDVVVAIREALERGEVVASVVLGGSRARGQPPDSGTGTSTWRASPPI